MAGIAPLSGSASTSAGPGISGAQSNGATPGAPRKPARSDAAGFTAFPLSYAGFGENGSSFGNVGVVDGRLSVVSSGSAAGRPQSRIQAPTPESAASERAPIQARSQSQTGDPALPGSPAPAPALTPQHGFLGAPATNPIVAQAEDRQRAAATAGAARANQAAAAQQADRIALQQIDARIAAARAVGNEAAVAQLQPKQAAVAGDLQGQTFAGLGSTPQKPFAGPEIPTVFLNIAS
jgi:hypothetical protein